ncbi:hypothetical protein VCR29J2_690096 [Vibrio coralliirubri]|nr:hypothetical protein VCR29J2_690096 [Vibrio coralliirubri]
MDQHGVAQLDIQVSIFGTCNEFFPFIFRWNNSRSVNTACRNYKNYR